MQQSPQLISPVRPSHSARAVGRVLPPHARYDVPAQAPPHGYCSSRSEEASTTFPTPCPVSCARNSLRGHRQTVHPVMDARAFPYPTVGSSFASAVTVLLLRVIANGESSLRAYRSLRASVTITTVFPTISAVKLSRIPETIVRVSLPALHRQFQSLSDPSRFSHAVTRAVFSCTFINRRS